MMMHSPQCARPFPKPRAQQDQGVIALSAPLQEPSATPFMPFSSGDEADLYAQSSAASSYGELEDMMPIDIVDPVMSFPKLDHRADEQDKPCRHAWGADTGPSPLPQLGSSSWDNDAAFVTTSSDEIEDTMPVAKEVDVHDFLHCSHEWDMETFGASPKRTLPSFLHNPKGDQQARPTKRYKSFLLTDTRVLPISDSISQKPDQKPGQPFDAADKKPKTRENGVKDTEPVLSLGNGVRRERKPPKRLIVNAWNDREPDTAKKARARSKLACAVASSFARKGVSDGKTKIEGTKSCNSSKLFATSSMKTKEDEVSQRYLDRGYKVTLCNQTSVVNKKIDIVLQKSSGNFSRSLFFSKLEGVKEKELKHHIISIDRIRSNGEGTAACQSNIFGKPLALHVTVTERCGVKMADKLVLRCYKEHPDASRKYLVQVNAGGSWLSAESINLLLSDIFTFCGFPVLVTDIRARPESCVYSVANRETFRTAKNQVVAVDIPKLMSKLQDAGFEQVKALHVTGGMSFQLNAPRCKPQIQKTGTIYMPFCSDPEHVRLTILQIILPLAHLVLKAPGVRKTKQ